MIMATEKRKSMGGNDTPSKFSKNQQGRSPGGGQGNKFGGKKNFGGQQGQGKPQQGKGGSPHNKQQHNKPQNQKPQVQAPKTDAPPPPPAGAKKMAVSKAEPPKANAPKPQQQQGQKKGKQGKAPLDKVAKHSKNIQKKTAKKSRFQKFTDKLAGKPRPAGACERAVKAEQELGHGGRVYLIKVQDPPITEQLIKSWNAGIETAVFAKSVEPRQFLVIFKHDADVKKGVEALKKTKFAGALITVEEKLDSDTRVTNNPDNIDPFCLYVTNLHPDATKEEVKNLFAKCSTVTNPRKHNPKIGTSTKFCFVAFETVNDALAALKENYNRTLSGNTIVMRYRRVSQQELKALETTKAAAPAVAAPEKKAPLVKQVAKTQEKKPAVKAEPESDEEDDEDEEEVNKLLGAEKDSDDEEDDDDDDDDEVEGEEEDDDDDDDDDDDLDEDEDDDDDDEDE